MPAPPTPRPRAPHRRALPPLPASTPTNLWPVTGGGGSAVVDVVLDWRRTVADVPIGPAAALLLTAARATRCAETTKQVSQGDSRRENISRGSALPSDHATRIVWHEPRVSSLPESQRPPALPRSRDPAHAAVGIRPGGDESDGINGKALTLSTATCCSHASFSPSPASAPSSPLAPAGLLVAFQSDATHRRSTLSATSRTRLRGESPASGPGTPARAAGRLEAGASPGAPPASLSRDGSGDPSSPSASGRAGGWPTADPPRPKKSFITWTRLPALARRRHAVRVARSGWRWERGGGVRG